MTTRAHLDPPAPVRARLAALPAVLLAAALAGTVGAAVLGNPGSPVENPVAWGLVVLTAAAATWLARARAARSAGERDLWRRLAVGAATTGLGAATTAVLVLADVQGQLLALPGALAVVLTFPLLYGGLVVWNRTGSALADPHETLNGIGSVLAVAAFLQVVAPEPAAGSPWWAAHLAALQLAAAFVLGGTAVAMGSIAATARDTRTWLVAVAFLPAGIGGAHWLWSGAVSTWAVLVPAAAALTVGAAAAWRPAALVPQPTDPIASTVGGYAVLVVSAGLMAAAALLDLAPAVTWLAGAAVVLSGTRLLINTRDLAELGTARAEARTDELTGLPNRRAVRARLVRDEGAPRLLALLDLDNFKDVNDALGHDAGDRLLRAVAERLAGALEPGDLLGRLAGDEFVVVAAPPAGQTPAGRAGTLTADLAAALADPVDGDGFVVHVQASIGIALDAGGRAGGDLLAEADVAMYRAKRTRGRAVVFDEGLRSDTAGLLGLVEDLRRAVREDQLVLHYQPQVALDSGLVVGVEALVRWRHPVRGLVPPGDFLQVAEEHGLMPEVTSWVLDRAVEQVGRWWATGHRVRVSVNLSAADLVDAGLPGRVTGLLAAAGVPPQALVLEVTETAVMVDPARSAAVLRRVAAAGVGVSLDDFGTGWSSLTYLRDLPATELKLDRSFTQGLLTDPRAAAIVASTVGLAHDLGLRVVAEGVEDLATFHELAAVRCDESQGFLHGAAVPAAELERSWAGGPAQAPRATGPAGGRAEVAVSR
ncbi:bifunctional diguanylate cyclase/phosphodiesterase [Klenkia sp. LSe6-5]|uniref:Bifunctional diguanylate cyclase/phosphodiesterase n=1 Tax=Klenkia sesuvii TaxID=3103137 RepID=A0ABU8DQN9_9ACTN